MCTSQYNISYHIITSDDVCIYVKAILYLLNTCYNIYICIYIFIIIYSMI